MFLIYASFVSYTAIQANDNIKFYNNFYQAFELIDSLSTATSFSAILQNTGFTLWRHYNKLAKPLPDKLLQDYLSLQQQQLD